MRASGWIVGGCVLVLCGVGVGLAQDGKSVKPGWGGKRVLLRLRNVALHEQPVEGSAAIGKVEQFLLTVAEERGGYVRVQSRGKNGWLPIGEVIALDEAAAYFTERLQIDAQDGFARTQRGLVRWSAGRLDEALADFNEAIRLDGKDARAYSARLHIWQDRGDPERLLADCNTVLQLTPGDAKALVVRAKVWSDRNELEKAFSDLTEAIRLEPGHAQAYRCRATAWAAKGNSTQARNDLAEAIRLDPTDAVALVMRGQMSEVEKFWTSALEDYDRAVQAAPTFADAHLRRASLWTNCPEPKVRDAAKAVESAKRACELTEWKSRRCLDALAKACHAAGDVAAAEKWTAKAKECP